MLLALLFQLTAIGKVIGGIFVLIMKPTLIQVIYQNTTVF